jgi:hypothetical protein
MVAGGLLATGGLYLMSFVGVHTSYWSVAFPSQLLLGLGLGFTFVPLSNLALGGAGEQDAGVAGAVLQAVQQVGASIGTALLATIPVAAITSSFIDAARTEKSPEDPAVTLSSQVDGYTTAFTWAAVLLLAAAVVSAIPVKASGRELTTDSDDPTTIPTLSTRLDQRRSRGSRHPRCS